MLTEDGFLQWVGFLCVTVTTFKVGTVLFFNLCDLDLQGSCVGSFACLLQRCQISQSCTETQEGRKKRQHFLTNLVPKQS